MMLQQIYEYGLLFAENQLFSPRSFLSLFAEILANVIIIISVMFPKTMYAQGIPTVSIDVILHASFSAFVGKVDFHASACTPPSIDAPTALPSQITPFLLHWILVQLFL